MIVAIISLITALFLGGPAQIFYVDSLEKGIKKNVLEKERKKDILSEIKSTKAFYKDFEKERKQDYKVFLNLYADKSTSGEELDSFFNELQETRAAYQNKLIDQRLIIFGKIEPEEWDNILNSSISVADKNIAKAEKKAPKSKEGFKKTTGTIKSIITDEEQMQDLLRSLENVASSERELENILLSINSSQNEILANKNAGKEELLEIVNEDSDQRAGIQESLLTFHEEAKEICSEGEWTQIMKSFTKEMQKSSR